MNDDVWNAYRAAMHEEEARKRARLLRRAWIAAAAVVVALLASLSAMNPAPRHPNHLPTGDSTHGTH